MINRIKLMYLLKKIEKNRENKLLIELKLIFVNKVKAEKQFNVLMTYKNEYEQQYKVELKESILTLKLINYNSFINFLNYGLSQQKTIIKDYNNKYQAQLSILKTIKYKLKIWDDFIIKLKKNMSHINDFKTQIQQDQLSIFYKNLFDSNK